MQTWYKMLSSWSPGGSSEIKIRWLGWAGQPPSLGRWTAWPGQVHLPAWLPLGLVRLLGGRVRVAGVHLDSARRGGVEAGGWGGGGRGGERGGRRRVVGWLPGSVWDQDCLQLGASGLLIKVVGSLLIVCQQGHSGRWLVGTQLEDGRPLTLSIETTDDVTSHKPAQCHSHLSSFQESPVETTDVISCLLTFRLLLSSVRVSGSPKTLSQFLMTSAWSQTSPQAHRRISRGTSCTILLDCLNLTSWTEHFQLKRLLLKIVRT